MASLFERTKELTIQIDDFLDAVSEGALVFQRGLASYMSGDHERFLQCYAEIEVLENRADELRRNRN